MSDEREIENELFNYSVNRGNQTYANEMRRKRFNLEAESCLAERQKWKREIVVIYSS